MALTHRCQASSTNSNVTNGSPKQRDVLEPIALLRFPNDAAGQIDLYLPATDPVFRNPFYQCEFTVLDSAADCQNSLADLGRSTGSLDYMSTFFSEHSAYRLCLRACLLQMAQLADPDRNTFASAVIDCDPALAGSL